MNLLDLARSAVQEAPAKAGADELPADPGVARRRIRALAMLDADPDREIAVIAEAGDPAHVALAVRGVAVGDLEIPADRYDAFALMALMEQCGHA